MSFVNTIRRALLNGLKNKSPKVTWNSCIAVSKTIKNPTLQKCEAAKDIFFNKETTGVLFDIIANKQNIKARNQAI